MGTNSSGERPRRRAISSGRLRSWSPAMVARATLMWFEEPSDLQSTSWMPASSRMARAAPPAMTPVPGAAGLMQHAAGTHAADDRVGDGAAGQGHGEEVLAGLLGALLDGEGHLLGLAVAEADVAGAVADHHQGGEGEATAALDHLGHAVDVDHAGLAQGEGVDVGGHQNSSPASRAASATAATRPWYRLPPRSNTTLSTPAALARSARSLPTSVAAVPLPVPEAPTVVSTVEADDQGGAGHVVDHLGADVPVGPEHGQAGTFRGAPDLLAHAAVAPDAGVSLLLRAVAHLPYFPALPALRTTRSSRYRTPLPL